MTIERLTELEEVYPACRSVVDRETWRLILSFHSWEKGPTEFSGTIESLASDLGLPGFLPDLARLEWAAVSAKERRNKIQKIPETFEVNPSLSLLELSWRNLLSFLNGSRNAGANRSPVRT